MKTFDRRWLLGGGLAAAAAGAVGLSLMNGKTKLEVGTPKVVKRVGDMPYRAFGRTGLVVSELSFGAWAIGGESYGAVERGDSLAALARAEELGCNLVDTASVYGDSESVLAEFLQGRRDRWLVSTKYSRQEVSMTSTLEAQLQRLGTDYVDFYMIHWVPSPKDAALFDDLAALKRAGKARFIGVSAYNVNDVGRVLERPEIDGLMIPFSLLDPHPFLACRERLAASGKAVMIRSVLKEGFLTGKYPRDARFTDPNDQRSRMSASDIATTVDRVEQLRFLEAGQETLLQAAIAYPLSYPEVSTTVLGVKTPKQADMNFGGCAGRRLSAADIGRVERLQETLGLGEPSLWRRLLNRFS
jgi:aryl-alcohol dehydrogenase-like predicted oxidoreductase